jgi:hypothetical protein
MGAGFEIHDITRCKAKERGKSCKKAHYDYACLRTSKDEPVRVDELR